MLMFNGRRGGDAVLNMADEIVKQSKDLRAVIVEAISADARPSDDSRTGAITIAIEEAASAFGAEVSSCVRRSWL
jgi:hypothetical protein